VAETTVHAIVLRRRDSGESDRRLTLLTREEGKIDVVAKGARKAASRLAGSSDPLAVAVMSLASGKVNRFVTQAQPIASFRGLRGDYDRLAQALALLELYGAVVPYEQPLPEAFSLLLGSLEALEAHAKPEVAFVWAQVRLLSVSGFMPQFDRCAATGAAVRESPAWLSPSAGGAVSAAAAGSFSDRYPVAREALVGLARLEELAAPPDRFKFAPEACVALLPIWRHVADCPLPATEGVVREMR
jgi:DNA repair protein RecO (recombination protein O)